jgi:hypothetical protein
VSFSSLSDFSCWAVATSDNVPEQRADLLASLGYETLQVSTTRTLLPYCQHTDAPMRFRPCLQTFLIAYLFK